jgi:REP element-mobilizing transposase RayT
MPRPQRIEYENAFYHVMNRGRGRQFIFHNEDYYHAFLETLNEVYVRFDCIIHGYCLMGNHYYLLIETPNANLSRIMRHINGVYTQRYNRLKKTDGSLFRGRYKAILVDKDEYILQLSRYIHRNPIDMKSPLVNNLEDYKWSSYRNYINKDKPPKWLYRDFIYEVLAHKNKYKAYSQFVLNANDSDIEKLYSRSNLPSIIGEKGFKIWIYEKLLKEETIENKAKIIESKISKDLIVNTVAHYYATDKEKIVKKVKGRIEEFEARKVAMYLCQQLSGDYLVDIANYFNLSNNGSVSFATSNIKKKRSQNKRFNKTIEKLIGLIVSKAT